MTDEIEKCPVCGEGLVMATELPATFNVDGTVIAVLYECGHWCFDNADVPAIDGAKP